VGFEPILADGTALVGIQSQYFRDDLGAVATLDALPYSATNAEAGGLADGHLDAAYLDPVAAVGVWQSSRGAVRIIAGGAATGGTATTVLVVTSKFLASEPAAVNGLLEGQVQANQLLSTNQTSAKASLSAELATLNHPVKASQLAHSLATFTFGNNPLAASVAAQAMKAAAAGTLKPVKDLSSIYDLAPLNNVLRADGLQPVSA
jgi:ABC-type nitrate/sulfonate/bicarbonate transport system substrate-binding protein